VLQPLSLFGLYILQNLVHGKFSINCYSFNFMHESCLKGKMLVDQPPSCHHPLHLPSATPPPPLKTTLTLAHQPSNKRNTKGGWGESPPIVAATIEVFKNFYGPNGDCLAFATPKPTRNVYCFNFTHRPGSKGICTLFTTSAFGLECTFDGPKRAMVGGVGRWVLACHK